MKPANGFSSDIKLLARILFVKIMLSLLKCFKRMQEETNFELKPD